MNKDHEIRTLLDKLSVEFMWKMERICMSSLGRKEDPAIGVIPIDATSPIVQVSYMLIMRVLVNKLIMINYH